jgi:glycosyltransferase involved in cell wall biosynthesis
MIEPTPESNAADISKKSNLPVVSVLLRTKNEETFIGETLESLLSQSYKNIELIIVDSGSTDNTLEIAEKYPVSIYEIDPDDFTFGYSLNYGIKKAKGEYIACLSAHARPVSGDWIEILVSNFSNDRIAAAMSNTVPLPDCNPFDRRGLTRKYGIPKQEIYPGKPYLFSNSCSMIRKSAWEKAHFDESLIASEDQDWMEKIMKLNYKVMYDPAAKVYHSHNETLKQIYVRYYRESYSNNLLQMEKYSFWNIIFDLAAGSIYDMGFLLLKRYNLKWFLFAPLRRLVMNYGRYKGMGGQ